MPVNPNDVDAAGAADADADADDGWTWMKVDAIGWNWMTMNKSEWKWMEVDESGLNWMRVDEIGWNWMKLDESELKWMKVDETHVAGRNIFCLQQKKRKKRKCQDEYPWVSRIKLELNGMLEYDFTGNRMQNSTKRVINWILVVADQYYTMQWDVKCT